MKAVLAGLKSEPSGIPYFRGIVIPEYLVEWVDTKRWALRKQFYTSGLIKPQLVTDTLGFKTNMD